MHVPLFACQCTSADVDGLRQSQRDWLKQSRNACRDETCLATAYKQRIAALSTSKPPEDAATRPSPATGVPTSVPPRAEPVAGNTSLEQVLTQQGYRHVFDSDGEQQWWWKRVPEREKNGWRAGVSVTMNGARRSEETLIFFKCSSSKMGLPLGPADNQVQWVDVSPGSEMAKVVQLVCEVPSSGAADAGAAVQSPELLAAGPRLSEAQARALFNARLGRCATVFAVNDAYDSAEKMMSGSSDTVLTRGAYVLLLQQSRQAPDAAKENYMDACGALGIVKGTGANSEKFKYRLTAYEAAHPEVQPEALGGQARALTARVNEAEKAEQRRLAEQDPMPKLQRAYAEATPACKEAYLSSVASAIRTAEKLRSNAALTPQWQGDLNNPNEQLARQQVTTVLNAMRISGCTTMQ